MLGHSVLRSLSWQSPEIADGSSDSPSQAEPTDNLKVQPFGRGRPRRPDPLLPQTPPGRPPNRSRQRKGLQISGGRGRQPERFPGSGSPSAATFSWLLSMSANSLAVSAEIPMAGASSTTATARPFVSQTIQPFVTFLTVYLTTRKALAEPSVPRRGLARAAFRLPCSPQSI